MQQKKALLGLLLFPLLFLPVRYIGQEAVGSRIRIGRQSIPELQEVPFWNGFADSVFQIWSPRFLGPDEVILADARDARIVIVNGSGRTFRVAGRRGEGPGEFSGPTALTAWGRDRFVVWDTWLSRLSLFDRNCLFQKSYQLQMPARGIHPYLLALDESSLLLLPRGLSRDTPLGREVVVIPASFDTFRTWAAPCRDPERSGEAGGMDLCYRTIGIGKGGTILVGLDDDYTIQRYDRSGKMLREYERLDPDFRPPSIRAFRDRPGGVFQQHNGLTCILEDGSGRFFIAGWIASGSGSNSILTAFIDQREEDGSLKQRSFIPDLLMVGDMRILDSHLEILAYHLGNVELPQIRLYHLSLAQAPGR
jgi:hypothetical protein